MRPTVFVTIHAIAPSRKSSPGAPPPSLEERVDARIAAARREVARRARSLAPEHARALLARFDAKLARLDAEVARAHARGEVTSEEAQAIRAATVRHRRASLISR